MRTETLVVPPIKAPPLTLGMLKPGTLYYWLMNGRRAHLLLTPPSQFPQLYIAWGILDTNSGAPLIYEPKCDDLKNHDAFEEIEQGTKVKLTLTVGG